MLLLAIWVTSLSAHWEFYLNSFWFFVWLSFQSDILWLLLLAVYGYTQYPSVAHHCSLFRAHLLRSLEARWRILAAQMSFRPHTPYLFLLFTVPLGVHVQVSRGFLCSFILGLPWGAGFPGLGGRTWSDVRTLFLIGSLEAHFPGWYWLRHYLLLLKHLLLLLLLLLLYD